MDEKALGQYSLQTVRESCEQANSTIDFSKLRLTPTEMTCVVGLGRVKERRQPNNAVHVHSLIFPNVALVIGQNLYSKI